MNPSFTVPHPQPSACSPAAVAAPRPLTPEARDATQPAELSTRTTPGFAARILSWIAGSAATRESTPEPDVAGMDRYLVQRAESSGAPASDFDRMAIEELHPMGTMALRDLTHRLATRIREQEVRRNGGGSDLGLLGLQPFVAEVQRELLSRTGHGWAVLRANGGSAQAARR